MQVQKRMEGRGLTMPLRAGDLKITQNGWDAHNSEEVPWRCDACDGSVEEEEKKKSRFAS